MDPEPTPDLLEKMRMTFDPAATEALRERLLQGPPPADTLVPAVILGVAAFLWMCQELIRLRVGVSQDVTKLLTGLMLVAALGVAGIRYQAGDEVSLSIQLIGAYGIPAVIALIVGLVAGSVIADRATPQPQRSVGSPPP